MSQHQQLVTMNLDELRQLTLEAVCSCYAYDMMNEMYDSDRATCIEIIESDGRCLHADNPDDTTEFGPCPNGSDQLLTG